MKLVALLVSVFFLFNVHADLSKFYSCEELLKNIIKMRVYNEDHIEELYQRYNDLFYPEQAELKKLKRNSRGPLPTKEMLAVAEDLIEDLVDELRLLGVKPSLITSSIEGAKGEQPIFFKSIEIDLRNIESEEIVIRMVGRYQNGEKVKRIIIDPVVTFNEWGDANFNDGSITINITSFIEQLFDGRVGKTLIHEFTHGKFSRQRGEGLATIFDSIFWGRLKPFTIADDMGYQNLFSFEELYNYSRDLNNAARINPRQLTARSIKESDLTDIQVSLVDISAISHQALMLASANRNQLNSYAEEEVILYGEKIFVDNESFDGLPGMAIKFDRYMGSFFLNSFQESIYSRYIKNCDEIETFLKTHKIKDGWKRLVKGEASQVLEEASNSYIRMLHHKIISDQQLLLGSLSLQQTSVIKLSSTIYKMCEGLDPRMMSLLHQQARIQAEGKVDREVLKQFNSEYQDLRLQFRKIAQLVMDAEGN